MKQNRLIRIETVRTRLTVVSITGVNNHLTHFRIWCRFIASRLKLLANTIRYISNLLSDIFVPHETRRLLFMLFIAS